MKKLMKIKYLLKNNWKQKNHYGQKKRIKKLLSCIRNMVNSENKLQKNLEQILNRK